MNLIHKYYIKYQQEIRFVFVGVINTIVGYGSYALFVYLGVYYLLANVLSYIVGTTNSYLWNKFFTFKSKKKSMTEVLRFVLVYVVSLLVNMELLRILVDSLHINKIIAGLPTLFVTTLISYFGHKFFSFRSVGKNEKIEGKAH